MPIRVHIISQLNAAQVKEELEKVYPPEEVIFELVPIEDSRKGVFIRELWLTPNDLDNLKEAEIILGDNMFMPQILAACPKVKWIQGTYAGVDTVFKRLPQFFSDGSLPSVPATRFSGTSFGKLMSDYCLGYIIAIERKFIAFRDIQSTADWGTMFKQAGTKYRSLDEITVTVLGFGAIGKSMCTCFTSMGCKVTAFARSDKGRKEVGHCISHFTTDLNEALAASDYICAILPDTPDTIGLLNGDVLKACASKQATLINVGRGSLVSSYVVINALDQGWLSAAVLDVFEVEPLPAESPLWTHPKVVVTPHISALTKPKDLAQVFQTNFQHFRNGEPFELQIDWSAGY